MLVYQRVAGNNQQQHLNIINNVPPRHILKTYQPVLITDQMSVKTGASTPFSKTYW